MKNFREWEEITEAPLQNGQVQNNSVATFYQNVNNALEVLVGATKNQQVEQIRQRLAQIAVSSGWNRMQQ